MLSNAYFLAKFRFDTAENEPAKILQNFANFANLRRGEVIDQKKGVSQCDGCDGRGVKVKVR